MNDDDESYELGIKETAQSIIVSLIIVVGMIFGVILVVAAFG